MRRIAALIKETKEKLKERAGETIVETLASMVIVVLAMLMLAGAIVAAARVNAAAEDHSLYLNTTTGNEITGTQIRINAFETTVSGSNKIDTGKAVREYREPEGPGHLYYYE